LIVDEVSHHVWVFLCQSKEPPVEIVSDFLLVYSHKRGGVLRTDQGGELARSAKFREAMRIRNFELDDGPTAAFPQHSAFYAIEPTGAGAASQNGGVEKWNDTLATTVRALLYSAGLPPKYWSVALVHAVYLHNRRVHKSIQRTPFEAWYGLKPNLRHLKVFGSRVCVKVPATRRAKLDRGDFRGIFLGYTATNSNIRYLDLDSGLVKSSADAIFDEAWYTQSRRPPAAQLLYDLGVMNDVEDSPGSMMYPPAPTVYPPLPSKSQILTKPLMASKLPLPLREYSPSIVSAKAAKSSAVWNSIITHHDESPHIHFIIEEYGINKTDMAMVYISPDPYNSAFEEHLDIRDFTNERHPTAGMSLIEQDGGRLILAHMMPGTPAAKIPYWRSRLKQAWLISVNGIEVHTRADVQEAIASAILQKKTNCKLLFAHPEIKHGLTNQGIPQVNMDQLNPRLLLRPSVQDLINNMPTFDSNIDDTSIPLNNNDILWQPRACVTRGNSEDDVFTYRTRAMKLTRGKLRQQKDWDEWHRAEWTQLDQYEDQGMFGDPVRIDDERLIFYLVWTYVEKVLDKRKKARCTCDGSTRAGKVRILDHTYANCVDQTGARIFYAASAAENLLMFGADVSNAFGEAPSPKQGFYIRPDKAFNEWWTIHKQRPPIPPGHVIPILKAMQGHPESPRLWERHVDGILRKALNFKPTIHEPCLYSGVVEGERVLFLRQVDDFNVAAPTERIANIVYDTIDEHLTMPLKRMGLVTLFNGMDITQSRHYIKLHCTTYIERICEKYLNDWLKDAKISADRPLPFPTRDEFLKQLLEEVGDPDLTKQA
jgi:hypothetical protein